MNNREIADAFMKGNYDGVRKLHEEKMEESHNKCIFCILLMGLVYILIGILITTKSEQNYKDDLETFKCKVEVRDKSLVDSLQNYCDTANCIHIIQK